MSGIVKPKAINDNVVVNENTSIVIDALGNDEGDNLSIYSVMANNGSVVVNADKTITYTPNAGFFGKDVVTYAISEPPQGVITHTLNFINPEAFDSDYQSVIDNIDAAITQWEGFLSTQYSVNIEIDIEGRSQNSLASAKPLDMVFDHYTDSWKEVEISGVQYALETGVDSNSGSSDGKIWISLDHLNDFWFDPTPNDLSDNAPAKDQYDFVSLIKHEFAHILGFTGNLEYRPADENPLYNSDYYGDLSIYDTFVEWDARIGGYVFTGDNAVKAYQDLGYEGNLPLYSEGDNPGSDLVHYINGDLNNNLMTPSSTKGQIYTINPIDLAILSDLGYNEDLNTITANIDITVKADIEEFQVNTTSYHIQYNPDVATLSDGSFVVVWASEGQDGSSKGVYAQRFDVDGNKNSAEILVNTHTDGNQRQPSISALSDGGYVITWRSGKWDDDNNTWFVDQGQDGSKTGIFSQRFNSGNNKVGNEVQVNTYTQDSQFSSDVEGLANGGYIVTWASQSQDGSSDGIYAQLFDENSSKNGVEFLVNSHIAGRQSNPDLAVLSNGGFIITWHSYKQLDDGSSYYDIFAQRYDADGNRVNDEFQVNTYTYYNQRDPVVAALEDGGFIVAWRSYNQDHSGFGIYAQRYDANGTQLGAEFKVNTHLSDNQGPPSIGALDDGGFIITWESENQDGSDLGVYAQRYDVNSSTVGSELQINTVVEGLQDAPVVSLLPNNGFVVTYVSHDQDGSGYGIFSQRYNANSERLGGASNTYDLIVDQLATEDQLYTFDVSTYFKSQNTGVDFTYSATMVDGTDLPIWLNVDSSTGIISGTPENNDVGMINITATATDANNDLHDSFYLTVSNINDAPVLSGDFSATITEGNVKVNGALIVSDIDKYFDPEDANNWTDIDKTMGESGESVYTRTNTSGDTYIYTSLENADNSSIKTYRYTLSNNDWAYQVETTDVDGNYVRHFTNNFGEDYLNTVDYSDDGSRSSASIGDVWHHGKLNSNMYFLGEYDSDGTQVSRSATSFTENARLIIGSMDGVKDNGYALKINTTQTNLGVDYLFRDGISYTIDNQQGVYGTLELNNKAEWIYTLDYADTDTVSLTDSQLVTDSFNVIVSDGNSSISQSIDINITGQNLDLIDGLIVDNILDEFNYSSVKDLYAVWNENTSAVSINFKTSSNDSLAKLSHLSSLVDISLDGIANIIANLYFSDVVNLSFTWNASNSTMQLQFDSAVYNGDSVATGDVNIYIDNATDQITLSGSVERNTTTINVDNSFLDAARSSTILSSYYALKLIDSASQTKDVSTIASLALQFYGFSDIYNLTLDWHESEQSLALWFDSALFEGEIVTDVEFVSSINSIGELDLYAGIGKINGQDKLFKMTDLTNVETFGLQVIMAEISRISVNDTSIDITLNSNGTISSFSSTAQHATGVISDSLDDLTPYYVAAAKDMFDKINVVDKSALIQIDANQYLDNTAIQLFENNIDIKAPVLSANGTINISQNTTFDTAKLSTKDSANAYNFDITISDAIAVLRDIVDLDVLTGNAFHAADVNNDGNITISDAIAVLRDIVDLDTIDTFDLVDSNNNRITTIDSSLPNNTPTWTIVANGDVNMSGSFDSDYIVMSDLI